MDFICADDPRPLIEDDTYMAQCVAFDDGFVLGKARKLFLHFEIVDGEHMGERLFMAFNMPFEGKIKAGSKYYKTWVMVNGWNKPSRNAKMSPKMFVHKIYMIRTRTVKPLSNGKRMPKKFWYSVVDMMLEVIAG